MTTLSVSISDIQDEIIKQLKLKFPNTTIESYEPLSDLHDLAPAILLDLESFPKGKDGGCGRYPIDARFSLHCVLGFEADDLQRQLREMAISVSQYIDEKSLWFGDSVVKKAEQIEAYPGNFKQDDILGYDSIVVSWEQACYLGDSAWTAPVFRDVVSVAINPEDENNKNEYQPIESVNA